MEQELGDIQYWISVSDYDYETAGAMLSSGRYVYVIFCCQQAVEKRLKAVIAQKTSKMPPKIHDLQKLAILAEWEMDTEQNKFLQKLTKYYIETRYPFEIKDIVQQVDRSLAEKYYQSTGEMLTCIDSLMK